jgi:DNA-binding transcriptional regulator YhcF (GntR family)/predicted kinase
MSSKRPDLVRSEALHVQIARYIRTAIEAGVMKDGDVLPSTRELAAQWDVSVFTISEAMKELVAEGLVVTKSRSNRVVRAPDQGRGSEIRMRRPVALIVGGYAGSGKTELGRILARAAGWPMLDKDSMTRPVVEAALELIGQPANDRESDAYLSLVRPREYEATMATAIENLECGNSVIVTAPFIHELGDSAWVDRTQARIAAAGAGTEFVWVYCDASTMHGYLRHRAAARDASKLADWPGYLATIDLELRPAAPYHLIDNSSSSAPLQNQADELLTAVLVASRPR